MLTVALPFPAKILWPNGRGHYGAKSSATKKHRRDAHYAALAQPLGLVADDELIPVHIVVHAKPKGPLPDRDNCAAAAKAYLDGLADRLKINDRHFDTPTIEFAEPRNGRFIITIGVRT